MEITKLIIHALREEYPAKRYDVYTEPIEQGFEEPCFSIRLLRETVQPYPGGRTLLSPHFDVRYFPREGSRMCEECRAVADKLFFRLRSLSGVRGIDLESEITDGVLHFFVSYPHFVRAVKDSVPMGDLDAGITMGGYYGDK